MFWPVSNDRFTVSIEHARGSCYCLLPRDPRSIRGCSSPAQNIREQACIILCRLAKEPAPKWKKSVNRIYGEMLHELWRDPHSGFPNALTASV